MGKIPDNHNMGIVESISMEDPVMEGGIDADHFGPWMLVKRPQWKRFRGI